MKLAIEGIGVVGGFGCGMESLATAISNGSSPMQHVSIKTTPVPAICLPSLPKHRNLMILSTRKS